ncbi:MAG: cytochrome c, partial [Bacteroidetes bacterium]|nr:cytochrome c [Bacteroidota bacterium]
MIPCQPIVKKLSLAFVFVIVASFTKISAQDGKALFTQNCQSCHNVFKPMTGPALMGLEDRHTWADHKELLKWVNNPSAYMAKDAYTQGLKSQ